MILLLFLLLAQPTLAANSSIGASSDVWATLVANIAPLLILVGEKHVKAYFKVMCRTSHYLLYAAGPIGLITAITTLIRLHGSRSLKRLIGRQYESRGEVLADVTSVSSGMVRFELRSGVLEQTTTPKEDDEAYFYIRKDVRGNAQKVIDWFETRIGMGAIVLGNAAAWWTVVGSFRGEALSQDDNPVDKVRTAARMFMNQVERSNVEIPGCNGSLELCAAWRNISLPLTAASHADNALKETTRLIIVIICFLGYVAIIVANWNLQHDIQNTVLVSIGLATSTFGAFFAALIVDRASIESTVDISALDASAAGYCSANIPWGVTLPFCPKVIVSSSDGQRPSYSAMLASLTNVSVMVMSVGYISLYLGLRTSEWWASLAILCTSAVASVARVFLVPDNLEFDLDAIHSLNRDPNSDRIPWPHDITTNYKKYTYTPLAAATLHRSSPTPGPGPNYSIPATQTSGPNDLIHAPAIAGPIYHTLAIHYKGLSSTRLHSSPGGQYKQDIQTIRLSLVLNSFHLVQQIRKDGLMPVDLVIPELISHQRPTIDARILFSDIICHDGVWRQPFEVFVKEEAMIRCEHEVFIVYLSSWFRRATAIRDGAQATGNATGSAEPNAKWISNINLSCVSRSRDRLFSPTISMWENTQRQLGTDRFLQKIIPGDYIWMAAKICFVYFTHETSPRLQQLALELNPRQAIYKLADYLLSPAEVESFVQHLKEIGLLVATTQPEVTTKPEVDHDDMSSSLNLIHVNRSNGVEEDLI
ncbi:hypothetical protein EV426DRAFT_716480 [Tirmania nivea]|nr:hypothetical protein EV426DRAFT_716480 [Tirmania nivea]